ncbi:MAG: BLUF domain-containing protein [Sphingobium sp.]
MQRILYISTARTPISTPELNAILAASRRNNAAVGITGLLVVGGRRFLQVLEGPEASVTATYDRIIKDPRHYAFVKLNDKIVTERCFADWAMGFEAGGEPSNAAPLDEQVAALIAPIADANLRAYFTGFANKHAAAA